MSNEFIFGSRLIFPKNFASANLNTSPTTNQGVSANPVGGSNFYAVPPPDIQPEIASLVPAIRTTLKLPKAPTNAFGKLGMKGQSWLLAQSQVIQFDSADTPQQNIEAAKKIVSFVNRALLKVKAHQNALSSDDKEQIFHYFNAVAELLSNAKRLLDLPNDVQCNEDVFNLERSLTLTLVTLWKNLKQEMSGQPAQVSGSTSTIDAASMRQVLPSEEVVFRFYLDAVFNAATPEDARYNLIEMLVALESCLKMSRTDQVSDNAKDLARLREAQNAIITVCGNATAYPMLRNLPTTIASYSLGLLLKQVKQDYATCLNAVDQTMSGPANSQEFVIKLIKDFKLSAQNYLVECLQFNPENVDSLCAACVNEFNEICAQVLSQYDFVETNATKLFVGAHPSIVAWYNAFSRPSDANRYADSLCKGEKGKLNALPITLENKSRHDYSFTTLGDFATALDRQPADIANLLETQIKSTADSANLSNLAHHAMATAKLCWAAILHLDKNRSASEAAKKQVIQLFFQAWQFLLSKFPNQIKVINSKFVSASMPLDVFDLVTKSDIPSDAPGCQFFFRTLPLFEFRNFLIATNYNSFLSENREQELQPIDILTNEANPELRSGNMLGARAPKPMANQIVGGTSEVDTNSVLMAITNAIFEATVAKAEVKEYDGLEMPRAAISSLNDFFEHVLFADLGDRSPHVFYNWAKAVSDKSEKWEICARLLIDCAWASIEFLSESGNTKLCDAFIANFLTILSERFQNDENDIEAILSSAINNQTPPKVVLLINTFLANPLNRSRYALGEDIFDFIKGNVTTKMVPGGVTGNRAAMVERELADARDEFRRAINGLENYSNLPEIFRNWADTRIRKSERWEDAASYINQWFCVALSQLDDLQLEDACNQLIGVFVDVCEYMHLRFEEELQDNPALSVLDRHTPKKALELLLLKEGNWRHDIFSLAKTLLNDAPDVNYNEYEFVDTISHAVGDMDEGVELEVDAIPESGEEPEDDHGDVGLENSTVASSAIAIKKLV